MLHSVVPLVWSVWLRDASLDWHYVPTHSTPRVAIDWRRLSLTSYCGEIASNTNVYIRTQNVSCLVSRGFRTTMSLKLSCLCTDRGHCQGNYMLECSDILPYTLPYLSSSRIQIAALGHTSTSFCFVIRQFLGFFPGQVHLSEVSFDDIYPLLFWSSWFFSCNISVPTLLPDELF